MISPLNFTLSSAISVGSSSVYAPFKTILPLRTAKCVVLASAQGDETGPVLEAVTVNLRRHSFPPPES